MTDYFFNDDNGVLFDGVDYSESAVTLNVGTARAALPRSTQGSEQTASGPGARTDDLSFTFFATKHVPKTFGTQNDAEYTKGELYEANGNANVTAKSLDRFIVDAADKGQIFEVRVIEKRHNADKTAVVDVGSTTNTLYTAKVWCERANVIGGELHGDKMQEVTLHVADPSSRSIDNT